MAEKALSLSEDFAQARDHDRCEQESELVRLQSAFILRFLRSRSLSALRTFGDVCSVGSGGLHGERPSFGQLYDLGFGPPRRLCGVGRLQ
jgi:hypothetical protein